MVEYKNNYLYNSKNNRNYLVCETEKHIIVYVVSGVSLSVQKGIDRDNGITPEQVVEKFLKERCEINLEE